MGIPSYFSHIVKKYKHIVESMENQDIQYDNLYMDSNSIIYDMLHSMESMQCDDDFEIKLINAVISKIEDYIKIIKPSNTIFIAFDGVAPLAKMNQQKIRRYKSHFMEECAFLNKIQVKWSSSQITPGTKFMTLLSKKMNEYFKDNKEKKYNVKKVIISAADEKGEGEHKLYEYMRKNPDINHNTAVYGLDADLIMLSIFHVKYQKNIYIFREAPAFMTDSENDELYILNIKLLCQSIHAEMSCKYPDKQRIDDYVFMCFLLGNDFLPHIPALNIRTTGINVILNFYNKMIGDYSDRFLTKDNEIQWKWFFVFIKEIAKHERDFLIQEHSRRDNLESRIFKYNKGKTNEDIFNDIPIMYRMKEKYICPSEPYWEQRYDKCMFGPNADIDKICQNYFDGLEWVYNYYTGAKEIYWGWQYEELEGIRIGSMRRREREREKREEYKISKGKQMMYVLSRREEMVEELREGGEELRKREWEWSYRRYMWESKMRIEKEEIKEIEKKEREMRERGEWKEDWE